MRTAARAHGVTRDCATVLLILTVAYLLLVVLPYWGNGIHLHSYQEIAGSFVDVKGYPPFVWFLPLQGLAMLAAGYAPAISCALAPLTLLLTVAKWRLLTPGERAFLLAACATNLLALALTWQERGIMLAWLVD